jgi:hypothetical protein
VTAVQHQHRGTGALVLALHDHQIFVRHVERRRALAVFVLPLRRVQQGRRRVEVQRVAEFIRFRRAGRLDAGGLLAGVVAAVAALAKRSEQVAQRSVAEKVQRFVGDFELGRRRLVGPVAATPLAALALGVEVGRRRNVALVGHPLDDLLNQLFELRSRVTLVRVGRIAEQPFDGLFRQHAAVEQRIQNRVVQRLHRPLVVVHGVRIAEPARQQQVRQLGHQILEIQVVQCVAGEFRVAILHKTSRGQGLGASS